MIISPRSTSWNYITKTSTLIEAHEYNNAVYFTRGAYTFNVVRTVVSCGLNGNVIISLKVNPSITARKQLTTQEQRIRYIKQE